MHSGEFMTKGTRPRRAMVAGCGLLLALPTAATAAHPATVTEERPSISASSSTPLVMVSPEATWNSMKYWKVRPSRMLIARQELIKNLRWSSWGSRRAKGSGALWVGSCDPSCAEGAFRRAGVVKVSLSVPTNGRFRKMVIQHAYNGTTSTLRLRHGSYWNWS